MTNLEKKLKEFEKTARFKELVSDKFKTDPNFANVSKVSKEYGQLMREILRAEIEDIRSSATGESFLDHIVISEEFIKGTGWSINVSFDEERMHRESLYPEGYPDGVELDVLFNEGYTARTYAFGTWHGESVYSRLHRDAAYFIQRAVDAFNSKYKGKAVAEYNSKYSGGTL